MTLDPANAAALSEADRHPDSLDVLAAWPSHFHLKNCLVREGVSDFTVGVADGVIDNRRWLEHLVTTGRCRAVSVEYCGQGDPHGRLMEARRYLDDTIRLVAAA